ncbi:MAG: hypothetical protein CFE45_06845 [Burkholderiales bacterium PBB5]|nr:MAG: hypothetical protein CFE45_06845 [Burkholderiales bacterium PBB5]
MRSAVSPPVVEPENELTPGIEAGGRAAAPTLAPPSAAQVAAVAPPPIEGWALEARRQQRLLLALWQPASSAALAGWWRQSPGRAARGLLAYRANGLAVAERALAAAYPTVAQLLGDAALAAVARRLWRAQPPERGDLACWGRGLADALAADPALDDWPWLPDVARLDLAVADAEQAADAPEAAPDLQALAGPDAGAARLCCVPGLAVLRSAWPLVTLWQAHREGGDAAPLAQARQALQAGQAQNAVVWRRGWRARVLPLGEADLVFTAAVLAQQPLAQALAAPAAAGHPGWSFEAWLLQALSQRWIAGLALASDAPSRAS